jgi:HEAT repeat protein
MNFVFLLLLWVQEPTVGQLLEQLRSDRADVRSRAEQGLKLRDDVDRAPLEGLTRDPDIEVAARARGILEVRAKLATLTPALLRAVPDARARLASSPHAWTEILLEAAGQVGVTRKHAELGRDDLLPLALAAATAATKEERVDVCGAVAAWQLSSAGPALAPWLDEQDWEVRRFVLDAVEWSGDHSLEPLLLERCRSNRDYLWSLWAGLLARMGNREILPDLLAAMTANDQNRRVGQDIYVLFERAGMVEAVPSLLRLLNSEYGANEVLPTLERLVPDEILPALLERLRSGEPRVRSGVLPILTNVRVTPELLPLYRKLLENPEERLPGLQGLGNLRDRKLLPEIRSYLDDPSVEIRRLAASILASHGDKSGLPELVMALKGGEAALGPMYTLRSLGAREAIPDLMPLLDHPKLRGAALDVLAGLGAPGIRPAVLEGLKSADPHVRGNAAVAITNLDGKKAIPLLLPLLDDPDFNIRQNTVPQMLLYLKATEAIPIYRKRLQDGVDPFGATSLLYLLYAISPDDASPEIFANLTSTNPHTRGSAAQLLMGLEKPEAVPMIRVLLRDKEIAVRRAAATALAWQGDAEGVPMLLRDPGYVGTLFELNVVRNPEVCRAWNAIKLTGAELRGSPRELLEELCKRGGITLEVSPGLVWSPHVQEFDIDGRNLLRLISSLLWSTGGAVVEEGKLRILAPIEGRPFWIRWWAGELEKSAREEDKKHAAELRAGLEEGERRRAERKHALAADRPPKPEELKALLTPFLRGIPGLEERLIQGKEEVWTRVFIEANSASGIYQGIRQSDFEALAPRAVRGALTIEELTTIYHTGAWRKVSTLRPAAIGHLKHSSPDIRILAARLLISLDGPKALPQTLPLLDDADPRARQGIVQVYGDLGLVEAAPAVRYRLDDPAVQAALPWAAPGLAMPEGLEPLLKVMKRVPGGNDDYMTRMRICYSIAQLGDPSITERVRDLLRTENHPNVIQAEISTLVSWGARSAVPELLDLVEKPRQLGEMYQGDVFRALAKLGAREAAPVILAHLTPEKLRGDAAQAAADLGLVEAIPLLRAALAAPPRGRISNLPVALATLDDRESIPAIRKLLKDEASETRGAAALALVLLEDRDSFKSIVDQASQEQHFSSPLRDALTLIRTPESRAVLARNVYYSSPRFNSAVAPGGTEVIASLRQTMNHQDVWTRWGAIIALGHVAGDEILPDLRKAMAEDESSEVMDAAALMLCRRGLREGVLRTWQHSRGAFQNLPFELNAVRSPAGWAKLREATLTEPFYGSTEDLLKKLAASAGLAYEGLPGDSKEQPALSGVQVRIPKAELPLSGVEVMERITLSRGGVVLEDDRLRVLPRKEAREFWKEWVEKEKR